MGIDDKKFGGDLERKSGQTLSGIRWPSDGAREKGLEEKIYDDIVAVATEIDNSNKIKFGLKLKPVILQILGMDLIPREDVLMKLKAVGNDARAAFEVYKYFTDTVDRRQEILREKAAAKTKPEIPSSKNSANRPIGVTSAQMMLHEKTISPAVAARLAVKSSLAAISGLLDEKHEMPPARDSSPSVPPPAFHPEIRTKK